MGSGEVRAGAAAVLEALTQPEQGRKKVAEAVAKDAADVLPLLLDLASQPAGSPRRFPWAANKTIRYNQVRIWCKKGVRRTYGVHRL